MVSLVVVFLVLAQSLSRAQRSCNQVDGDYPGCGISKSTYSATDPVTGKQWLSKYFPVQTPSDECTNDICECPASTGYAAWEIQQGRVYTTRAISPSGGGHAGNGFGLHLVNVSAHLTTGGLSTAAVEAHFTSKLGDMSTFDSFMDFNVAFSTENLQGYKDTFDTDGVEYLSGVWSDDDGTEYTSIFVRVPGTQLILELVQSGSLSYDNRKVDANVNAESVPLRLEQRVPLASLAAQNRRRRRLASRKDDKVSASTGSNIVPLVVNRAVSAKAMARLEDFYVGGMGTMMSHNSTSGNVSKKCFLWPGATVDICFTSRPDSETSGDWKVGDFEDMLNTVHSNIINGYPFCPMDKWEDNHYAVDSKTADTSLIINYLNSENPYHICEESVRGSAALHYVFDPTGWGIQLDLGFTTAPNDCSSTTTQSHGRRLLSNPACTVDTSACPSGLLGSNRRGLLASSGSFMV